MNLESDTRQHRRRSRTRAALVAAAERLFAERGPDAVSVDQIVAQADVAKGTFYNHFTDKDDVAREIARGLRAEIEAEVTRLNARVTDPAERVARALAVFTRFAQASPDRARVMNHANATNPDAALNTGVRNDIHQGRSQKRFIAPNRNAAVLFVIGTVQASTHRASLGLTEAAAMTMAGHLAALLLRGLGIDEMEAEKIATRAAESVFAEKGNRHEHHPD